ncbi:hypothetical protein [Pseudovibrio exalbescens]|uniref:hypothetical protein n=1 Tax=Pseudovibrio exalbescens TaxID=197461 RepID=UPI000C9CD5CF|nr:hypothetical protein [Pseudovibrio exalbescens]
MTISKIELEQAQKSVDWKAVAEARMREIDVLREKVSALEGTKSYARGGAVAGGSCGLVGERTSEFIITKDAKPYAGDKARCLFEEVKITRKGVYINPGRCIKPVLIPGDAVEASYKLGSFDLNEYPCGNTVTLTIGTHSLTVEP